MEKTSHQHGCTLAAAAAAIVLLTAQPSSAVSKALKVTGFEKLCETSTALKAVTKFSAHKIIEWHSTVKALEDLAADLKAATAPRNGTRSKHTVALLLWLQKQSRGNTNELASLAKKATFAATASAYAAGLFDQTAEISYSATKTSTSNSYCLEQESNTNKLAAATTLEGCLTAEGALKLPTEGTDQTPPKVDKNKKAYSEANRQSVLGQDSKCRLTQTDNTNGGYVHSHGNIGTVTWAGGYLTFTAGDATATAWADTSDNYDAVPPMTAASKALAELKEMATAGNADTKNVLKLAEAEKQEFTEITTTEADIGYSSKDTEVKIKPETLEAARKIIKEYRTKETAADGLDAARNKERLMEISTSTLAPTTKNGGECPQVTQDDKSDAKKEAECNAKQGSDRKPPCKVVEEEDGKKKCTLDKEQAKKIRRKSKTRNRRKRWEK
uniref:Variant surface glycoprotein 1125.4152 n=1 Tax=Trypanosoma brucei TaxID=5691 RepID=A0A1J0RA17_9TRYP|nr:variant surface glycoprotein 1125.4152 [Trypanosoma brucei]